MIKDIKEICCGCNACAEKCPQNCIDMQPNSEGFMYPRVDEEECIHCGICKKVCPELNEQTNENKVPFTWGGQAQGKDILLNSSSGGIFSLLANAVLREGGCVFGAAFTDDFHSVHHIRVDSEDQMDCLQGSKYLQSDTRGAFSEVRDVLGNGKKVLFSGTPCQVSALKSFLGEEKPNLLCVDVICHGTPSSVLWSKYLQHLEKKYNGNAIKVNFRDKKVSWQHFGTSIKIKGIEHFHRHEDDSFMHIFLNNYCLRESCYCCKVKENGSRADITLGDFWGIDQIASDLKDEMGTSLVLVHTARGKDAFVEIMGLVKGREVDYKEAISHNVAYDHSVSRPIERDVFFQHMQEWDWIRLAKEYGEYSFRDRTKAKLKKVKRAVSKKLYK